MSEQSYPEVDWTVEERKLEAAVQRAVRETVLASAYAGVSVAIWRDGKVVWLTPDEIFKELNAPPIAKKTDSLGAV
jgi:hypothetical protein